jgi:hypothetical protein
MKLKKWMTVGAVLVGGIAQAHVPVGSEGLDPRLAQQLDQVCGTFGASYVDATHWTLFHKRDIATDIQYLCLDSDCGPARLKDGYFQRDVSAQLNTAHRLAALRNGPRSGRALESAAVTLSSKTCPMGDPAFAPDATSGLDIVLTIEKTTSSLPGGYPTMGAVVQSYAADGTYTYRGAGGPNQLQGPGTYTYVKTSHNTAMEDAMQSSDFFTLPYHMEYTFTRPDSGHWVQQFAGGLIVFEGSFATSPTDSSGQWAPHSLAGSRITLLSSGADHHPCFELVRTRYDATTFSSRNLGADATTLGTYVVHWMSARSLVEEESDANALRLVRVYTFTHARGGGWQETDVASGERVQGFFRYND